METKTNPLSGQEWARCDVYLDGAPGMMPPRIIHQMTDNLAVRIYTPRFIEAWRQDGEAGSWEQLDPDPSLTPEDITCVVNEGIPCPVCFKGRDWVRFRGLATGVVVSYQVDHGCHRFSCIGQRWRKLCPEPKYLAGRLETLKPSTISMLPTTKQREYIAHMQQHPDDSYLLHGKSGTGKTHFACCLMYRAVERWSLAWEANEKLGDQSVFFVPNTGVLLDQIQYARQPIQGATNPGTPVITLEGILRLRKNGQKVTLTLDEFDKFPPTETRLENLERLVGAVYSGQGQIIAMSNTSEHGLEQKWQQYGAGEPILRRICGPEAKGHSLGFFAG